MPIPASSPAASRPLRIAINGYGRIGRCYARALHERGLATQYQIVAINEPADLASMVHLTRFDSTHGRFNADVQTEHDQLLIDGQSITVTHADTPEAVNWADYKLDLLIECSGCYSSRHQLQRFLDSGCPRILLSQPANSAADIDATIVHGVNDDALNATARLVSAASCTTNAAVPVLALLQKTIGLQQVMLTTLHSAMNDQPLIDGYHHADLRRTRSAMQSMIPVSTALARGVERLLPALAGKVEAKAIRVPIHNVSAIDMTVELSMPCTVSQINQLLHEAAQASPPGLLGWSDDCTASIDFNHDAHSAIIDGGQIRMLGERLLNLLLWFDNEWGFANRMIDVTQHWLALLDKRGGR